MRDAIDNKTSAEQRDAALASAAQLTQGILKDVWTFLVRLLPGAIRLICVTCGAIGIVYGTLDAWQAFGGDGPALIPALALGIIPVQFAFIPTVHYGGMIASGTFTYLVAQGLLMLPGIVVQVLVVVVLATITFSEMARRTEVINDEYSTAA